MAKEQNNVIPFEATYQANISQSILILNIKYMISKQPSSFHKLKEPIILEMVYSLKNE